MASLSTSCSNIITLEYISFASYGSLKPCLDAEGIHPLDLTLILKKVSVVLLFPPVLLKSPVACLQLKTLASEVSPMRLHVSCLVLPLARSRYHPPWTEIHTMNVPLLSIPSLLELLPAVFANRESAVVTFSGKTVFSLWVGDLPLSLRSFFPVQ